MGKSTISLFDSSACWRDEDAKSIGYFSKLPLACIDQNVIKELKDIALESGMNTRLSLHQGPDHNFHEMIIFQHRKNYYPPKKHPMKDKSFHVLEGEMAVFAYDAEGNVSDAQRLDGREYLIYRVAADIFHTDIPLTEYVIHHECTLGPFLGDDDRIIAPWAPPADDEKRIAKFRDEMVRRLADFE